MNALGLTAERHKAVWLTSRKVTQLLNTSQRRTLVLQNITKLVLDEEVVFVQRLDFCQLLQVREETTSKYIFS